jgi:hypothetical protein
MRLIPQSIEPRYTPFTAKIAPKFLLNKPQLGNPSNLFSSESKISFYFEIHQSNNSIDFEFCKLLKSKMF